MSERDRAKQGRDQDRIAAAGIALLYMGLGFTWILLSDRMVDAMGGDPAWQATAQTVKGWAYVLVTSGLLYLLVVRALRRRRRLEQALDTTRQSYHLLMRTASEGVWEIDLSGNTVFVNPRMLDILGARIEDMVGKDSHRFLSPASVEVARSLLRRRQEGDTTSHEIEMTLQSLDGKEVPVLVHANPVMSSEGNCIGSLRTVTDLSELRHVQQDIERMRREQRFLMNELDHRVRNNLSNMLGLIGRPREGQLDASQFAASLRSRVESMARAYHLLASTGNATCSFQALVTGSFTPEELAQVTIEGEPTDIPASQCSALAMLVHELIEASRANGALESEGGRVSVRWKRLPLQRENPPLLMEWRETTQSDQPRVLMTRSLELVRGLVEFDLHGRADMHFEPKGLCHRFEIRLDDLVAPPASGSPAQSSPARQPD